MRKLFFALSFVGMLMTQSLSYATTFLNSTIQNTEQQGETVEEDSMIQEAPEIGESEAVEEEVSAPAEASFTQELKKRFIEGGPGFMGIVLICLILGLAIAIERIIYLSDSEKLEASDLQFSDALTEASVSPDFSGTLNDATREFQIQLIRSEIKRCRGNMTTVARQLGLHRSNLYRKMGQLGMSLDE